MKNKTKLLSLVLSCLHCCMIAASALGKDAPQSPRKIVASDDVSAESLSTADGYGWKAGWKVSARTPAQIDSRLLTWPPNSASLADGSAIKIQGTNGRNNPARRELQQAFVGDELFVRFLLRYDGATIDTSHEDEGEFFVTWLDDIDGSDGATHNANVPNIGLHVATDGPSKGKNVFMVRIGHTNSAFSNVEVQGDRTYFLVGRLSKSIPGASREFDTFELWVDPKPDGLKAPLATSRSRRGINLVRWIGFATGLKTEPEDRIWIDEIALGSSWESVLGLPEVEAEKSQTPIEPRVDFASTVVPLLQSRCFTCHAGDDAESGVRLDAQDFALEHLVPGSSKTSELFTRITSSDPEVVMPPSDSDLKLNEDEVATLQRWIDQGAAWDNELLPPPRLETDHWSFQALVRPQLPIIEDARVATGVDAFVVKKQNSLSVSMAATASRATLIRRLSLDLLGLPPTPEEVDAFVSDKSVDAYERLVDRLLASPQYGERWGRHWLDLARWAESNGHQHNRDRDHAWRYRDYVVDSFNEGKPYDRFLLEQIAGDELTPYSDENIIATGFLAAAQYSGNELDKAIQRNDILVDIVNATSSAVLGLTMECAQCHNHKFDPITARDYYRLQGVFLKGQPANIVLRGDADEEAAGDRAQLIRDRDDLFNQVHERLVDAERKKRPAGEILMIPKTVLAGMTKDERKRYDELGKKIAAQPQAWGYYSPVSSPHELDVPPLELRWPLPLDRSQLEALEPTLLVRGDVASPGPTVGVGWPLVFGEGDQSTTAERPRTAFAEWLTSRHNPLTARVWVNRVWQHHFGVGLVKTPSDFGVNTPLPSHPELLDWLASELVEGGWSTRHLHRLIVLSETYQQSSTYNSDYAKGDPENVSMWRRLPRRLEAEALRDAALAASGQLDQRIGGISDREPKSRRRTLYQFQKRQKLAEVLQLFDGPNTLTSCSGRRVSTAPLQPLYMLNNDFMNRAATEMARRVKQVAGDEITRQITVAFQLTLCREPDQSEIDRCIELLSNENAVRSQQGLFDLCIALLNSSEFVYLP